jgi:quercetin dioxygenase-like cupin family protein
MFRGMTAYFDDAGETTGHPGWFFRPDDDIAPLHLIAGLEFRAIVAGDAMASFVRFEPNAPAPAHHHAEQQIALCVSGELTFTVSGESHVMQPGDCVVIPPHAEHSAVAGPEGCLAVDFFTPPRSAMLPHLSGEQFLT